MFSLIFQQGRTIAAGRIHLSGTPLSHERQAAKSPTARQTDGSGTPNNLGDGRLLMRRATDY